MKLSQFNTKSIEANFNQTNLYDVVEDDSLLDIIEYMNNDNNNILTIYYKMISQNRILLTNFKVQQSLIKLSYLNHQHYNINQRLLYYQPKFDQNPYKPSLTCFIQFLSSLSTNIIVKQLDWIKVLDLSKIQFNFMDSVYNSNKNWLHLIFLKLNNLSSLIFSDETINEFISNSTITYLVKSINSNISGSKCKDGDSKRISNNFNNLKRLIIPGLNINTTHLIQFLLLFKNLKQVDLSNCIKLDDNNLILILNQLRYLNRLNLSNCDKLTTYSINYLLNNFYFDEPLPPYSVTDEISTSINNNSNIASIKWKKLILPKKFQNLTN
ncbi:hypothetical protein K502DRAFT_353169 [Neoconidiobolus thromboides FSU 785]|nr:hypothetical protein K502DRAFT_353169 [Neoconidiobolus thromboides FSU 785]